MTHDQEEDSQAQDEEDPFWSLALQTPEEYGSRPFLTDAQHVLLRDGHDDYDDDADDNHLTDNDIDPNDTADNVITATKFSSYRLPYTSTTLELASLQSEDGIWGPLGGHAWYASALLATMILQDTIGRRSSSNSRDDDDNNKNGDGRGGGGDGGSNDHDDNKVVDDNVNSDEVKISHLNDTERLPFPILPIFDPSHANISSESCTSRKATTITKTTTTTTTIPTSRPFRVLELGSGAVGLPGLACAVALQNLHQSSSSSSSSSSSNSSSLSSNDGWQVCLTDNDDDVLRQLRQNVQHNINRIVLSLPSSSTPAHQQQQQQPPITVHHLDWGNTDTARDSSSKSDIPLPASSSSSLSSSPCLSLLEGVDVVIGSELVYTEDTAHALVSILQLLLRQNPTIHIWIVQVTDRFGWNEIVLDVLEKDPSIVVESIPIPYQIHTAACKLIPMGGTLDRYAFGAVCIHNNIG